jgi:hypothetical protein
LRRVVACYLSLSSRLRLDPGLLRSQCVVFGRPDLAVDVLRPLSSSMHGEQPLQRDPEDPVGARKSVVSAELRVRQGSDLATMIGTWLLDCSICCSARCCGSLRCWRGVRQQRTPNCSYWATRSRCCGEGGPASGRLGRPSPAGWARAAAAPPGLAGLVRSAGNAAGVASRPRPTPHQRGRRSVAAELYAPVLRLARENPTWGIAASTASCADSAARSGQHRVDNPAARRGCSGTQAVGAHSAAVPASPGQGCAGGGLVHRGDGVAAAAVRAVCDRGGDPPGPCARGDRRTR